jgi:type IV secretory pathway VirB4 component
MSLWRHRRRATTAQLAVLYPGVAPPGPASGRSACLGADVLGGGAWRFDPFHAYATGMAANPNVVVFGDPGAGKSAAVKTMIHRWVGLHHRRQPARWVAICDPKGEYRPLARVLGLEWLALRPGGPVRLNPLDAGAGNVDSRVRQAGLLAALSCCLLRRDLSPVEDAAIGWVVDTLADRAGPVPTLADAAGLLAAPTAEMAHRAAATPEALARSIEDLRFALGKLLDRELRGMFDGPSTVRAQNQQAGVVIDLSAVHDDRTALGVVMAAATAWIASHLARRDGTQRIQVIDEAWALLANPASVRHLQASWKLCRDYGVANLAIAHRIADLRAQADDGTALAKIAAGLLGDTETRILFRQAPDQVAEAKALLGLTSVEADLLPRLGRGRALWKRPGACALVQHIVAPTEWRFANTDSALLGTVGASFARKDKFESFPHHEPNCSPFPARNGGPAGSSPALEPLERSPRTA